MSEELQSLVILASALSGVLAAFAGLIFGALTFRYTKLVKAIYGTGVPKAIIRYSLISTVITLAMSFFLLYRMGYVATQGKDFDSRDWVLFDSLIGINLFVIALRGLEEFKSSMRTMLGVDEKKVSLFNTDFTDLK
jgi:hypothetical protein